MVDKNKVWRHKKSERNSARFQELKNRHRKVLLFNSSFLRLGDDAIWRILISFAPHSFGCFRLPEHSFLELPLEICLIHISQQRFAVESHEFVRDRTERSAVSSLFSASRPRLSRQQNLHMWYYLKRISLQFLFFQNKK